MFSSIKLYQQLHMFHMSLTASHMALSPDGSALALADSEGGNLEVYNLPGKLVAASGEEEGLTSNRDFGLVCGTVESGEVSSVECLGDSVLTTSHSSRAVKLWRWRPGEDLLHLSGEISHWDFQPSALQPAGETELVVWGETCLARTDMDGLGRHSRRLAQELLAVMTAGQVSWCLERGGQLSCLDWRQPGPGHQISLDYDVSHSCIFQRGAATLVAARTGDTLRLWDVRSPSSVLQTTLAGAGGQVVADSEKILVTEDCRVSVFSLQLQRLFCHEAHKAEISSLISHPTVRNLIISADTSKRLQAWVFNNNDLT